MTDDLQVPVPEVKNLHSASLKLYNTIDTILMISHALQELKIPMWVGFNSLLNDNNDPKQIVSYLTPINSSPTNTSVVLETMKKSANLNDLQQS